MNSLPATMLAVQRSGDGGPEVLSLTKTPVPRLKPGEVLVKVTAAGVNRADVLQRKGHYPPPPGASDILGLEASGRVAAVGIEHGDWQVGDDCLALLSGGGYAEYVAVPHRQLVPPPPGLDLVTAAGVLEVAATVQSNADLARLSPGETFLVHGGAGGIGSFAIPYAKALGCTVWTTAGSEEKLQFCRDLGADRAVSYREDWAQAYAEAGGTDVILDIQGARYLAPNLGVLKQDGRLIVIGLLGGRRAELDLGPMLARRLQIIATTLRSRTANQLAQICAGVAERVWPLYAAGRLSAAPTKVFEAADVAAAHTYFDSGEHRGKIVLTLS
jgi:putative PIG3 family NAD(P)H quinone oxidoreductase